MRNRTIAKVLLFGLLLCGPLVQSQDQSQAKPHAGHSTRAAARAGQSGVSGELPYRNEPTDPNHAPTFSGSRVEEGMRRAVNPCNTDYGQVFARLQDDVVQNTIQSWVWWAGLLSIIGLLVSLFYIYFLIEREDILRECFARAAAILIGQRNTAYEKAREAIGRHNALVLRHNDLLGGTANVASGQNLPLVSPNNQVEREILPGDSPVIMAKTTSNREDESVEVAEDEVEVIEDKSGVPMAFKVICYKEEEYVSKKDRDRQVLSLERKIDSLRNENRRLKDVVATYEGVN